MEKAVTCYEEPISSLFTLALLTCAGAPETPYSPPRAPTSSDSYFPKLPKWNSLSDNTTFVCWCLFVCLFVCLYQSRISHCSPGCPGIHLIDQTCLKLKDPPADVSWVLGLRYAPPSCSKCLKKHHSFVSSFHLSQTAGQAFPTPLPAWLTSSGFSSHS
jgi:hypothetical protein